MANRKKKEQREADAKHIVEPFLEPWLTKDLPDWAAFRNFAVGQVLFDLEPSDDDIEDATEVDGPNDLGIDAWWRNTTEVEDTLYLIQSKDTAGQRDDLSKLKDGFTRLFETEQGTVGNRPLRERCADFRDTVSLDTFIEFHLVTSRIAARSLASGDMPLEEGEMLVGSQSFKYRSFVHDIETLAQGLKINGAHQIPASFTVSEADYFLLAPRGGFKVFSAVVKAAELVSLYESFGKELFRLNPRYYLGRRTSINRGMLDTLKNEPAEFHLYNNGLTATCSAVNPIRRPNGQTIAEMSDFQIVNGCQTTVTLHQANTDGVKIDEILVPLRVVETSNATHQAQFIAERTNSQQALRIEDFRSANPTQRALQAQFDNLSPPWYYEIKRGGWDTDRRGQQRRARYTKGPFATRKVKLKDLAQACAAFRGEPHIAVEKIRTYLTEEGIDELFPPLINVQQVLLPYQTYLTAKNVLKQEEERQETQGHPYGWSLMYLRYPLVDSMANVLRNWLNEEAELGYLTTETSIAVLANFDSWAEKLLKLVLEPLVDYFDDLAREGRAPRSLVRGDTWREEALKRVLRRSSRALDDGEWSKVLPISLPSPRG